MSRQFLPYSHQAVDKGDVLAVTRALRSEWLTQGPAVGAFERAIARQCGARYALALSSGTAALHAAYQAAGFGPGDEVLMSPLTFAATANMAVFLGAKPVFADIQEDTLNIDPGEVAKRVTKRTKAVVATDFGGRPCEYEELLRLCRKRGLTLLEDAAHALGAAYRGRRIGSVADTTVFSFHPVKAITTGEGGMVVTSRKAFAEKVRRFRNHGIEKKPQKGGWYYEIADPGFNYRLTDIQAALGLSQFRKLGRFLKRRRELALRYNILLQGVEGLILPGEEKNMRSAWHLYPVQIAQGERKRRKVFDELRAQGIGVQVHYMPLHLHPFYRKKFGYRKGDFPKAVSYYERALSIPLFPAMTRQDQVRVVTALKRALRK